jgi:glutamate dehydrogenase
MTTGTLEEAAGRLQKTMKVLKGKAQTLLSPAAQTAAQEKQAELSALGVPDDLAGELSLLRALVLVPEIALVAEATAENLDRAAATFTGVTETLRIGHLLNPQNPVTPTDRFEEQALARSLDEISAMRRAITILVLNGGKGERNPLGVWHAQNEKRIARATTQLAVISDSGELTLAKYVLAASILNELARGNAA